MRRHSVLLAVTIGLLLAAAVALGEETTPFIRGDANQDKAVDVSDPSFVFQWLYNGGPAPECLDAADANDDGTNDGSDGIYLLSYLYDGGPEPPYPGFCGGLATDPTHDFLGCERSFCAATWFIRAVKGDVDVDGFVDADDLAMLEDRLAMPWDSLPCDRAGDVNDDDRLTPADVAYLASYLQGTGPPPAQPFPVCWWTDGWLFCAEDCQ